MVRTMVPEFDGVSEEQHREMRAVQGRCYVEQAAQELYLCWLGCKKDGWEWPADLDEAHGLLWAHLGRDEASRRRLLGLPETEGGGS